MSSINERRIGPFLICGVISFGLTSVSLAARNLYVEPDQSILAPSLLAFVGCGLIARFVRSRAQAWRYLWLVVAGLSIVAAWQIFMGFLGTPSELIPRTRGENAPGPALFVLLGDIFMGTLGPAILGLFACVALLFAWLLGRQKSHGVQPR